jgi:hypothetical protein
MKNIFFLAIIFPFLLSGQVNQTNFLDHNWATFSLNASNFDTSSTLNFDSIVFHKSIERQFPDSTSCYTFTLLPADSTFVIEKTNISSPKTNTDIQGVITKISTPIGKGSYLLDTSLNLISFKYKNTLVNYDYQSIGKQGNNPLYVSTSTGDYRYKLILTKRK